MPKVDKDSEKKKLASQVRDLEEKLTTVYMEYETKLQEMKEYIVKQVDEYLKRLADDMWTKSDTQFAENLASMREAVPAKNIVGLALGELKAPNSVMIE